MKKTMFVLIALLLSLVMAFAMNATAFAVQEGTLTGGSITIDNAVSGQRYSAYQILYIESYNAATDAYAYKANSAWKSFVEGDGVRDVYLKTDGQGYVTWVGATDDARVAAFAKLAQAAIGEKVADATATADSATVKFENLKLGYYLIDTTLGTLCSLNTTNPDARIEEKNAVPTIDKQVQEDADGSWGKTNDADIGQVVNYKAAIKLYPGSENVVMTDTMTAGLTYQKDAVISNLARGEDYTVSEETDRGFKLSFTKTYLDSITAREGVELVVTYSAKVNENAAVGLDGNTNTTKLQYGDSTNLKTTPDSTTTTYTWDMEVLKYANGDKAKNLEGAQFVLLNAKKDKVATVVNGKLTGWTNLPGEGEEWPANTVLTTDAAGKISIAGLDSDTYFLREIKAPDGYNMLANDVKVVIRGATKAEGSDALTYTTVVMEIENKSGAELPSTGGIGTTVFYVVGGALVLIAVVLLVTRKKMNATKD